MITRTVTLTKTMEIRTIITKNNNDNKGPKYTKEYKSKIITTTAIITINNNR